MTTISQPEESKEKVNSDPWTSLLMILENEGVPSISPGECMRLTSILHKVNAVMLDSVIGSDHEEIMATYLCSLQVVCLVNSRQIELATSEMFDMFEDIGMKPLGSNQLDKETEDAKSGN